MIFPVFIELTFQYMRNGKNPLSYTLTLSSALKHILFGFYEFFSSEAHSGIFTKKTGSQDKLPLSFHPRACLFPLAHFCSQGHTATEQPLTTEAFSNTYQNTNLSVRPIACVSQISCSKLAEPILQHSRIKNHWYLAFATSAKTTVLALCSRKQRHKISYTEFIIPRRNKRKRLTSPFSTKPVFSHRRHKAHILPQNRQITVHPDQAPPLKQIHHALP